MLVLERSPWPTLTLVVSLEAIFLSTFVMIGQNRQAAFHEAKADHDYVAEEQELKLNTELTREIHGLTLEMHRVMLDPTGEPSRVQRSAARRAHDPPRVRSRTKADDRAHLARRAKTGRETVSVVSMQGGWNPAGGSPQAMVRTVEPSQRRRVCGPMPDPPILIVSPQDDAAFRRLAEEALAAGADTPTRARGGRSSAISERARPGSRVTAEPGVMWYVYREGHWIPRGWHEEGDHRDG